jgi:hypothetical protein
MRELNAQKEIVDIAFANKKLPKDSQGLKIYKSLVLHRFYEVLSNGYPIFFQTISEKKFKKLVYEFMRYGAKSTVMWKMPNEFRKFIKKQKALKDIPFVNDLLWFEWIEVALMMKNYELQKNEKFSFKNEYKLNKNSVLKKLKYKVFEEANYENEGEYYLLAYYDFNDFQVYYREISLPLYLFLKELNKNGLKKAIKLIADMSDEKKKSVKEFFKEPLEELVDLSILKRI